MAKQNDTKNEQQTDNQLVPARQQAMIVGGTPESMALAGLSEDMIADAIEAARELEMSFTNMIPVATLAAKGLPLYITDVVTIVIANKKPKPGEGDTKPVQAFKFETGDGLQFFAMFGCNAHRDRVASAFTRLATKGCAVRVGPVKIVQRDVGQLQPAWVFENQPGFTQQIIPPAPALASSNA